MIYVTIGLFFAGCLVFFFSLMMLSRTLEKCIEVMKAMKEVLTLIENGYLRGKHNQ